MKRREFIAIPVAAAVTTACGVTASIAQPKQTPTSFIEPLGAPAILLHQKRNHGNNFCIGVMWEHNGDYCRSAVSIPANPTADQIIEAFDLLNAAMRNPSLETCAFGEECLTGREQKLPSSK